MAVWLALGVIGVVAGCSTRDECGGGCSATPDDSPAQASAGREAVEHEQAPADAVIVADNRAAQAAVTETGGTVVAGESAPEDEVVDERPPNPLRELKAMSRIERKGGLVIEDLQTGAGAPCWPGGVVIVRYEGRLADGTVFDNNFEAEAPNEFSLKTVLEGWKQGVPGMRVGGKRRLTIPPEMGYGEEGVRIRPGVYRIPPDATLIFDIEVIGVRQQMKEETERSSVGESDKPVGAAAPVIGG
jgi:FKBP-type peptidyl-prolyl cis-trans isomerase